MVIWLVISRLFVINWFDLFEIIWWLFDDDSGSITLIIWCLFDDSGSITLIIWWLYLIIIRSQLFVIICWLFVLNYSWLFVDYLISTPAADRSACLIFESLRTAPWHIMVMAACPREHITACELGATHHLQLLPSLSRWFRPAERSAPLRPQRFSARGGGPSCHAISDDNWHPATYPISYVFAFVHPYALRDVIVDSDLI